MSKVIKIKILDPVQCKTMDKESWLFVRTILSYEKEYWRPGQYRMEAHATRKFLIDRHGYFLTGFLPRIIRNATLKEYQIELEGALERLPSDRDPYIPGVTFREDQIISIREMKFHQRGIFKAVARYGKTITAGGLISCYPNASTLFLCHTLALLEQTEDKFKGFGFDVGVFSGMRKELGHQVTLATHQSYVKRKPKDYMTLHDIIIIDECQHVASLTGNYAKILRNSLAPVKIGLTATPPEKQEEFLAMEGLLGPIIHEITPEMAMELGLISKPKVIIKKIQETTNLKQYKSYADIYRHGVMLNRNYNRLIVNTAKKFLDEKMTVLILVNRVQHGFYLQKIFNIIVPELNVPFLCGGIDSDSQAEAKRLRKQLDKLRRVSPGKVTQTMIKIQGYLDEIKDFEKRVKDMSKSREELRKKLHAREVPCVIATNVWNEGIDIPSLNVLINGGGGKSEIRTIQVGSRSLTAHEGKEHGLIVDFFNPNHVKLIEHFGMRFSIYCDEGWI